MFASRRRNRSLRSSRFVPGVDGLTSRIVPVSVAPLDFPPLIDTSPTPQTETTPTQTDESYSLEMAEMLRQVQAECQSTWADI